MVGCDERSLSKVSGLSAVSIVRKGTFDECCCLSACVVSFSMGVSEEKTETENEKRGLMTAVL